MLKMNGFLRSGFLLVTTGVYLLTTACTPSVKEAEGTEEDLPAVCDAPSGDDVRLTQIAAPSGVGSGSPSSDGPGVRRVLLATSSDGVNFTRSSKLLSDQANTPNMVVDPDGRILLYYTAYDIDPSASSSDGSNQDGIAVAVSGDQGVSWKYYCVGMSGFAANRPPIGDPDVVRLDDGTYRMYVTNGDSSGNINIYSATSTDGLSFVYEGLALNTGSHNYKDSLTTKIGSQWVMYLLRSDTTQNLRATSTNGVTFTMGSDETFSMTVGSVAELFVLSNWLKTSSGTRVFAFSGATNDIRSYTTTNGSTFTADTTVSLGLPLDSTLEKSWVKDAAVQQLSGGSYLMAYVSEIP